MPGLIYSVKMIYAGITGVEKGEMQFNWGVLKCLVLL